METLDGFIGKIINSLKENNLYDNTLIIYASDHGEQIGERDLWWKQTFYEESVKIPLIMSWKDKLPCNERRKQILNLVDLTATIVDAGEGMELHNIDGKSFLNIAINKKHKSKNETFSEFCMDNSLSWSDTKEPHLSRMIRTDDWKFIYYHGYNNQLFNLKNDPDEMKNLSGLKEYSKIETKLNEKILNSKGAFMGAVIKELSDKGIKLNITAVYTFEQTKKIYKKLNRKTKSIISIFAGRMADKGKDPLPIFKRSISLTKKNKNVEILWASTREVYNYLQARQLKCNIITMPPKIINQINSFGKSFNEMTLDTVKGFQLPRHV